MANTTTQHNAYVPGYKPTHIQNHTMRTAENCAAYLLPTLKSKAQANPHLKLLDCGAGPGTITVSFAKYMPQGSITATDLSDEVVQRAISYAESQNVANVSAQAASIYELPFEDNSFDIVHAHQVLCHLDQPLEALNSMLRVCKPGGVVAIREMDGRMFTWYPESVDLTKFHKLLLRSMDANGGDSKIGVRLVSLALEAGVARENVQASMGTMCFSTKEEREGWGGAMRDRVKEGGMRQHALDLGFSEEDLDRIAKAWDEWIAAEDGCYGIMNGEIIITK